MTIEKALNALENKMNKYNKIKNIIRINLTINNKLQINLILCTITE